MKRKIGFLLALIGISILILFGYKVLSGRSPKEGVLKVNSTPVASIFLENKHLGRTPFEDKVGEGEYTVKLVPESTIASLSSWQGSVKISSNLLTYINADLAESEFMTSLEMLWLEKISSKVSEIAITSNPDGATVSVDGQTKGLTPAVLSDIVPGDHTVMLASPGFLSRTIKVKTTVGYKLNMLVKLALSQDETTLKEATPSGDITPTPTKAVTSSSNDEIDKPYVIIQDTPVGFLRVREEPATSASESGRVNPGEKFSLLDEKNGWYEIKFNDNNTGWISGQYAKKVE